ncbi:MAG: alpha/beta fold hydrolase [Cephaloticoccus sp.]|nr:alpha/beta fold hydrolase [Cephaloticoccus sp.]
MVENTHANLPAWLQTLYPFAPKSFRTPQGARMSYVDTGGGDEAVLLLHGNPTWSFYYSQLIQAVAPQLRCVAPDHIGMGLSAKPEDYPYTLETRIMDIEALVATLGLKKIHLVVHDWGGAIGSGFAARHPELLGRLVVLNTAAWPSPHIPLRIAACRLPGLGPLLVRGANAFAGPAVWMSMARRKLSGDENRALLLPYDSWDHRVAVNAFVQDIPMQTEHPTRATLVKVGEGLKHFSGHPMLIVWGGRDFCFNDRFYAEWRDRFPTAGTRYLPDAGHYVLLDAAAEIVPEITAFLRGKR